ncbi:unnamed protein product, partial [marine sediment metagenome]
FYLISKRGKWWLFAKLNEHTIQQALDNDWYVALDPWWDINWGNYKILTIESDYIDSDLANFPILVNSTNATLIAKCDGGDSVRFVNIDNITAFAYEIEEWNAAGFSIWVKVGGPSIPIQSGSDYKFLMYYNNSDASDNQDPDSVWSNGYVGVYHLNESAGAICYDSTSNSNDGTYNGNLPTQTTGNIAYGQDFDGTDDYISLPAGCYLSAGGTTEIWFEADATNADYRLYT